MRRIKPSLLDFARGRRQDATYTEAMLWRILRSRKVKGLKVRRETVIEGYIADFYCPDYKLIIEIDGVVHNESHVKARDIVRQQTLEDAGYRVLRFTSDEVFSDTDIVASKILQVCAGLCKKEPSEDMKG